MAASNRQDMPSFVLDALKAMGYHPDTSMLPFVEGWWAWYTATDRWYDHSEDLDGHRFSVKRLTLHPARRVCEEWASVILDDDGTKLGCDSEAVSELLGEWAASTRFVATAQRCLGRAFGVGTGALALWFDVRANETLIRARAYDARMVLPLSWDDDSVAECAFVTRAYADGQKVSQMQAHLLDDATGTYHVLTRVWDDDGRELRSDGIIADFDTGATTPTFAILRPALDNVFAEGTYMGQSIFADAVDAIKGVDGAYDSLVREVDATKVKIFMSDELFDMQTDATGKRRAIPMSPDNTVIRRVSDAGIQHMYEVYSPAIRSEPITGALNAALSQLGSLTGFGPDYFRFDKGGGLRTATEVASDNSAFMRNIRKHENELRPQLVGLLTSLIACQAALNGWPALPEGASVTVDFDDSIIQDTASEKQQMLSEIASGVVPAWMYLVRFYGMGEEQARELAAPQVLDFGA